MSEDQQGAQSSEASAPKTLGEHLNGLVKMWSDVMQRVDLTDLQKQVLTLDLTIGALKILSSITGGAPILPAPDLLARAARISNQIVSFVLDDKTHYGSGVLVGSAHVLTAAHLFFDPASHRVDRDRIRRTTVEAPTTLINMVLRGGPKRTSKVKLILDPPVDEHDVAQRDVTTLDFAIIELCEPFGDDDIGGNEKRQWVEIPRAASAPVLSDDLVVHVFEFLDRKDLLMSTGFIRGLRENATRVLHTASTAPSASGGAIVNARLELAALHLGGPFSGEVPSSNRGLPIRLVAEIIDRPGTSGHTIRKELQKSSAASDGCADG